MRALLVLTALALPLPAFAQARPVENTRALGMGSALRGSATGDAALALNPSGMSLVRVYAFEAQYLHARPGAENDVHVSIVDSTSSFNISGGVYYTYLAASPGGGLPDRSGHEGGLALSVPFGDKLFIGGTVKYLRLTGAGDPGEDRLTKGFTFDAGVTLRPVGMLGLGVVGYNLAQMNDARAPRALGGGVTLAATDTFLVGADAVLDFDSAPSNVVHFMGGVEYTWAKTVAVRLGGGRRGDDQVGWLSGGVSFLAEIGALDFGVQQQLAGAEGTYIGVSARLFVPSP